MEREPSIKPTEYDEVERPRCLARAPVVAVAGEQAHALALALDDEAIAVVLYFMQPIWAPAGTLVPRVGMQGSNGDFRIPHR
jgi:hypothetical protein